MPDSAIINPKRRRFPVRFGLLELLLVTAVIAAWLPLYLASGQFETLRQQNEQMRAWAEILDVRDRSNIHAMRPLGLGNGVDRWKVYVPEDADYELRFAVDDIHVLASPKDYERVTLPAGEHTIALLARNDRKTGSEFTVYIDQVSVIHLTRKPQWTDTSGSRSASDVPRGRGTRRFVFGQTVKLLNLSYSINSVVRKHGSIWPDQSSPGKGMSLWISLATMRHDPAPRFVTPLFSGAWGHFAGLRIEIPQGTLQRGTINIRAPYLQMDRDDSINRFAIHVLTEGGVYESSATQPSRLNAGQVGLEIYPSDALGTRQTPLSRTGEVPDQNGSFFRLFLSTEAFASGAKPVIEVLFDSRHPYRVGFITHAASDSTPMKECVISATSGTYAQLRQLHATDALLTTTEWYPQPLQNQETDQQGFLPWKTVDCARFPLLGPPAEDPLRLIKATSDVSDYSALSYSPRVSRQEQYDALSSQQRWLVPEKLGGMVAVNARSTFEKSGDTIPGGPAIADFEVRIPFQSVEPIWFEVLPQ